MDARFDPTTRQKVDDLAKRFRRPCSAVLCHSMQWGLRYERVNLKTRCAISTSMLHPTCMSD